MTTIPADIASLRAIAVELDAIAARFARMVPESAGRDDDILASSNAAYAAKARANDSATLMTWAIAEQTGGES